MQTTTFFSLLCVSPHPSKNVSALSPNHVPVVFFYKYFPVLLGRNPLFSKPLTNQGVCDCNYACISLRTRAKSESAQASAWINTIYWLIFWSLIFYASHIKWMNEVPDSEGGTKRSVTLRYSSAAVSACLLSMKSKLKYAKQRLTKNESNANYLTKMCRHQLGMTTCCDQIWLLHKVIMHLDKQH